MNAAGDFDVVIEAYEDAQGFLHQCAAAYFDPSEFRRSLNAYVQSARNITFRIQSLKGEIPNFDTWYQPWQKYLKSIELMKWIVEARNTVTKKQGLTAHSRATVRTFTSYGEPSSTVMNVDPQVPTSAIVSSALSRVPMHYRKYWTVEVSRRWEIDDLPGKEVMAGIAEATRVYAALINDLGRFLEDGNPPLPLAASWAQQRIDGLGDIPEIYTVVFDPASGEPITSQDIRIDFDPVLAKRAEERYGTSRDISSRIKSADLETSADAHIEMAMRILASDGNHNPFIFMRAPDHPGLTQGLGYRDKQDKFLMMAQLGEKIKSNGFTSFVIVAEAWQIDLDPANAEAYIDFEEIADKREVLHVIAASADGYFRCTEVPFQRKNERIVFGEARHAYEPADSPVVWPLLRAWGRSPEVDADGRTGASDTSNAVPPDDGSVQGSQT